MSSLRDLLARGESRLGQAGVPEPRREARRLLAHALGLDATGLLSLDADAMLPRHGFELLLDRRAAREPLAYLTGRQGFWTLDLAVSPATLIPRADSETLIEALIAARPDRHAIRDVLDLGTGTGCLLLATLSEYGRAWGVGIDLSEPACHLAAGNAAANGLTARAAFVCGDWGDALGGRFDVILANPPYVAQPDLDGLMPEVGRHEPRRALDGGADGLDAYRRLVPLLGRGLRPDGLAVLEVGIGQADAVAALGAEACLRLVAMQADLGGGRYGKNVWHRKRAPLGFMSDAGVPSSAVCRMTRVRLARDVRTMAGGKPPSAREWADDASRLDVAATGPGQSGPPSGRCCDTLMNMKRMRGRNHRPGGGGGGGGSPIRHHSGQIPLNRNHVFDSNGPDLRIRGTAQQLFEKYLQLGRDATSSGDRVMAEGYFQHAEHYFRILNAIAQATQQSQAQPHHNNQRSRPNMDGEPDDRGEPSSNYPASSDLPEEQRSQPELSSMEG